MMNRSQSIREAMHPFAKHDRSFGGTQSLERCGIAVVDKCSQRVLAHEVRHNVARVTLCVRSPCRCDMLVLKLLCLTDIFLKAASKVLVIFLVDKWAFPTHVDIIRSSWEVDPVPNLQADSWR